jgi:bifunctional DNase/RNase
MLEMQVVGIAVDPNSGGAVLMLQDEAERTLAICIGLPEASSISAPACSGSRSSICATTPTSRSWC